MQLLGDSFSNAAAAIERITSAILDALGDVPMRAWVVVGAVALAAQLLWIRRAGR